MGILEVKKVIGSYIYSELTLKYNLEDLEREPVLNRVIHKPQMPSFKKTMRNYKVDDKKTSILKAQIGSYLNMFGLNFIKLNHDNAFILSSDDTKKLSIKSLFHGKHKHTHSTDYIMQFLKGDKFFSNFQQFDYYENLFVKHFRLLSLDEIIYSQTLIEVSTECRVDLEKMRRKKYIKEFLPIKIVERGSNIDYSFLISFHGRLPFNRGEYILEWNNKKTGSLIIVTKESEISLGNPYDEYIVRPVVELDRDTVFIGKGTVSEPYKILGFWQSVYENVDKNSRDSAEV